MSLKARDYFSPVKYGAKWLPSDLAGMIGLPYVGNIFYIDPTNGADTNGGKSQNDAFKTLTTAYAAMTDNHHDVIVLVPGGVGSGTGTTETAAITWAKSLSHLVGNVAATPFSSRARITTSTASVTPFITVSGSGNSFQNVQVTTSAATGLIGMKITGSRNNLSNCHIGVSNATAKDSATSYDLQLSGGSENYFTGCTIGFDTVNATAACANIECDTAATRNVFDDCIFPVFADADAPFFLKVAESGLDRYIMFRRCAFINNTPIGATTMTDACSVNANPGGSVILQDCLKIGATGWGDAVTHIYGIGASSNSTYNQGIGFAVNPAA
jgi:hypothetical protein